MLQTKNVQPQDLSFWERAGVGILPLAVEHGAVANHTVRWPLDTVRALFGNGLAFIKGLFCPYIFVVIVAVLLGYFNSERTAVAYLT